MAHLSVAELASNRMVILAAYRHLLRATGLAFKGSFCAQSTLPFLPPTEPL